MHFCITCLSGRAGMVWPLPPPPLDSHHLNGSPMLACWERFSTGGIPWNSLELQHIPALCRSCIGSRCLVEFRGIARAYCEYWLCVVQHSYEALRSPVVPMSLGGAPRRAPATLTGALECAQKYFSIRTPPEYLLLMLCRIAAKSVPISLWRSSTGFV